MSFLLTLGLMTSAANVSSLSDGFNDVAWGSNPSSAVSGCEQISRTDSIRHWMCPGDAGTASMSFNLFASRKSGFFMAVVEAAGDNCKVLRNSMLSSFGTPTREGAHSSATLMDLWAGRSDLTWAVGKYIYTPAYEGNPWGPSLPPLPPHSAVNSWPMGGGWQTPGAVTATFSADFSTETCDLTVVNYAAAYKASGKK